MEKNCNRCVDNCLYNGNWMWRAQYVNAGCELGVENIGFCKTCGAYNACLKQEKYWCIDHRKNEIVRMKEKTDAEILKYLECLPSVSCPYKKLDLARIMQQLADERWYQICHSGDDWAWFKKENNIQETEEEYVLKYILPNCFAEAMDIIEKKEAKHASLTLMHAQEGINACLDCPPDRQKICNGGIPDSWVGFPDLYLLEAMKRGLIKKMQENSL